MDCIGHYQATDLRSRRDCGRMRLGSTRRDVEPNFNRPFEQPTFPHPFDNPPTYCQRRQGEPQPSVRMFGAAAAPLRRLTMNAAPARSTEIKKFVEFRFRASALPSWASFPRPNGIMISNKNG